MIREALHDVFCDYLNEGHTLENAAALCNITVYTARQMKKKYYDESEDKPSKYAPKLTIQQIEEVKLLFDETARSMRDIAREYKVSASTIRAVWERAFGAEAVDYRKHALNPKDFCPSGERHPKWKGGVTQLGNGYKLVPAPPWYEGYKDERGRALEHLIKWCQYNDKVSVPEGHHIHHRNEDKTDNSPENLELLSNSEHAATHASKRHRDYYGRFI